MTPKIEAMLREFDEKFSASKDPALWVKLAEEEVEEFRKAAENVLKELADVVYVLVGLNNLVGDAETARLTAHLETIDNGLLGDLISTIFTHVDAEELVGRIHASNMSKLGEDGQPVRREDGKILKPEGWTPPDLAALLNPAQGELF